MLSSQVRRYFAGIGSISTHRVCTFFPVATVHRAASFSLALKVALAQTTPPAVLVFDEVDRGVGGAVADAVAVPVIASGGVGNLEHLIAGVRDGHAAAVLAASIFHFGEFTISEAKRHMAAAGLPMRLKT